MFFLIFFDTPPYTIIARLTDGFITIAPCLCKYITLKSGTLCLYSTFITGQVGGWWLSPYQEARYAHALPMPMSCPAIDEAGDNCILGCFKIIYLL